VIFRARCRSSVVMVLSFKFGVISSMKMRINYEYTMNNILFSILTEFLCHLLIYIPYLLECNAHLFWPNYVVKIRVRITFDGALDSMANLKNTANNAVV
jgi:hypothetical protein